MDPNALASIAPGGATVTAAAGMSMWELFLGAEPVIKLVMLALIGASFWSWTIIIQKILKLRSLYKSADHFEEAFWSGGSLDELYERLQNRKLDPLASTFCAAMREWRRSLTKGVVVRSTELRGTLQQ